MRDYLFSGPYLVTISNLPAGIYDLYVYAHGDNTGQATSVDVNAANGGASGSTTDVGEYRNIYQAGAEGNSYLRLSGTVGASGAFSFMATYLNGFQLQPVCDVSPITDQPTNVTASAGDTVQFTVSTTGTGLTYQWRKNGVMLTNSASISGVTSNVLTIDPVALSDIALSPGYDCLVSTPSGCLVLSDAAKLYVYSTTFSATPLSPANLAIGVCRDTVLRLNFNQAPTVNSTGWIRIYDASNTNTPVDQIDLGQNVSGAQSRTIAGNTFKAYPVLISGNTATIFPNLNKLAANKTYFVTIDPGTFSDSTGALYTGLTNTTAWQFTTKAAGPANSTNLIVAADGSGDFCTVQGALDFLPSNNTQPTVINVRNGQYTEIVNVNNKHKITFIGENREQTRIGYPNNNTLNPGAPWRACFVVNGNDNTLHTLTVTNMTPKGGGQAEAVDVEGTRAIFYNMNLASYQDTFLSHNSGQLIYMQDSLVQGDTDFMWGYGTIYITNCEIQALSSGTHVTQPRSPSGSNGFAFVDCRVTKGFSSGTFDLGRTINTPASQSQVLFMRCLMDDAVTGYASDAGVNMGDYACSNLTATAAKTLANSTHYTSGNSWVIAAQTAPSWLYGWVPQVAPVIHNQPTNQTVDPGATAAFTVSATGIPAPAYQWRKDGTNLVGETGATLTVSNAQAGDAGTYSVIVSNAAGSVTSSNAVLQLDGTSEPVFTTQPTNQSASVGSTVNFVVAATGVPAPVFQWLFNGTNLSNATNATLTLVNVQVTDVGVYSVIASNSVGAATSSNATFNLSGANGFAMINGSTTGGAGGSTVTVTNGTDFITHATATGPRIVQVQGALTIGTVSVKSDKTILGLGTNATLLGRLSISGVTNVIVQNLRITNPGNDGISIRDPNTHHVWVDHVTFNDCGDGSCDISQGADYVTVSWCKFIYPTQLEHRFTMIADGQAGNPNSGRITLHHNWWSTGADQRMAASSYARVHYYNNYFNCTNNSYASNARTGTEINSENNYYSGVNSPIGVSSGTDGKIRTGGNIYSGCTGTIHPGTDSVFSPPYGYLLDATADVPAIVMAGAGAPGPDTVPVPPKIWDGGGANNNLNTANNWGLNEAPGKFDTLLFAGATRPAPNNDFAANTEFRSLLFSNDAGTFVVGGNTITLGDRIADDSANGQTINLNLDFNYAGDHFTMERVFEVSAPSGTLVINGSIVGYTNTFYGKSHFITKLGPGLLTLTGGNSLYGPFNFKGGLVRFGNLSNLGNAPQFTFDGGGLQWAPGNTTDISGTPVTISSGGATFDVGANNVTFVSPVGVGGAGGLTKLGPGRLTLNGDNSYSGATLISQGSLALGAAGALPISSQIILSNNAVLDVSGRSDGMLTVGSGKKLVGGGSVLGSVTAASGSTIAPGFSIGTLVVTNVLTFQSGSTNVMEMNAAAHTNDLITGMASVNYGGRLVVSNLGGVFAAGDSFKLFSAGSYNGAFSSIEWPALNGSLYWTNLLAVDGTIAVVSPVNTTPTNINVSVAGGLLQLSWPDDHKGWRLEAQTNSLAVGLSTNWASLGYESTNAVSLPISSANSSVFYRLAYP